MSLRRNRRLGRLCLLEQLEERRVLTSLVRLYVEADANDDIILKANSLGSDEFDMTYNGKTESNLTAFRKVLATGAASDFTIQMTVGGETEVLKGKVTVSPNDEISLVELWGQVDIQDAVEFKAGAPTNKHLKTYVDVYDLRTETAVLVGGVHYDGRGGDDSFDIRLIEDTTTQEKVTMAPHHVTVVAPTYTLEAEGVGNITVKSLGGGDILDVTGAKAGDVVHVNLKSLVAGSTENIKTDHFFGSYQNTGRDFAVMNGYGEAGTMKLTDSDLADYVRVDTDVDARLSVDGVSGEYHGFTNYEFSGARLGGNTIREFGDGVSYSVSSIDHWEVLDSRLSIEGDAIEELLEIITADMGKLAFEVVPTSVTSDTTKVMPILRDLVVPEWIGNHSLERRQDGLFTYATGGGVNEASFNMVHDVISTTAEFDMRVQVTKEGDNYGEIELVNGSSTASVKFTRNADGTATVVLTGVGGTVSDAVNRVVTGNSTYAMAFKQEGDFLYASVDGESLGKMEASLLPNGRFNFNAYSSTADGFVYYELRNGIRATFATSYQDLVDAAVRSRSDHWGTEGITTIDDPGLAGMGTLEQASLAERLSWAVTESETITETSEVYWDEGCQIDVYLPSGFFYVRYSNDAVDVRKIPDDFVVHWEQEWPRADQVSKRTRIAVDVGSVSKDVARTGLTYFRFDIGMDVFADEGMYWREYADGSVEQVPLPPGGFVPRIEDFGVTTVDNSVPRTSYGKSPIELGIVDVQGNFKPSEMLVLIGSSYVSKETGEVRTAAPGKIFLQDPVTKVILLRDEADAAVALPNNTKVDVVVELHDEAQVVELFNSAFGRAPNAWEKEYWRYRTDKSDAELLGAMQYAKQQETDVIAAGGNPALQVRIGPTATVALPTTQLDVSHAAVLGVVNDDFFTEPEDIEQTTQDLIDSGQAVMNAVAEIADLGLDGSGKFLSGINYMLTGAAEYRYSGDSSRASARIVASFVQAAATPVALVVLVYCASPADATCKYSAGVAGAGGSLITDLTKGGKQMNDDLTDWYDQYLTTPLENLVN